MAADHGLSGQADVATMVGAFAFVVFAMASMAQLVVGSLLDRLAPRTGVHGRRRDPGRVLRPDGRARATGWALALALGFMLGAFGQIPINDFMIGKMASGAARARVYGMRYVVSFTALAAALPLIAFVYEHWGFDTLFYVLAALGGGDPCAGVLPAAQDAGRERGRRVALLDPVERGAVRIAPGNRPAVH